MSNEKAYVKEKENQKKEIIENKKIQEKKTREEKAYEEYVKTKTPVHNVYINMVKAFIVGGCICVVGQWISNYCISLGIDEEMTAAWTAIALVGLSVILTGFGLYAKLANFGGAGALVPITGFANSVASPAIEYKKEGQVYGIGAKIFTIAGPVILYGVFTSWILGLIYWGYTTYFL